MSQLLTKIGKNGGPPYDIVVLQYEQKTFYLLEIAISGFPRDAIKLELIDQILLVQGTGHDPYSLYLHKGLARRDFKYLFEVSSQLILQENIQIMDGILRVVFLKKNVACERRILTIS